MTSRGAPGTHVCWRCQLLLLKHPIRASAFQLHSQRPRGVRLKHDGGSLGSLESPNTRPQNFRDLKPEHSEDVSWGSLMTRKSLRSKTLAWRPLQQKKSASEHPLGRLHGFRFQRLREKAAGLSIDSLGKPSEVIVLRDAGFEYMPLPEIEESKVGEKVDILAQVDAERGLVRQADVEKSIEEFKPKTKVVTWVELQSIQRQLTAGFTTAQLVKYTAGFQRRQGNQEPHHKLTSLEDVTGAILRKTNWLPGTSDSSEEFDERLLRGYRSEALTPKQRLVLLMLRQCWQLEAQELVEAVGEVELQIRDRELELLILGRKPPLRVVSDKLIASQDEKIEAFRSRGVIRVTAAKEKSKIIVQEIQDMLLSVRSLEVDLHALNHKLQGANRATRNLDEVAYDDSVIDELARLTETKITRLPNNLLAISCIDVRPEAKLSTKADVARRLLLTSSDASDLTKTQNSCKDVSEPLIAVKYHVTDGMSWCNRLRQWVRWTSAMPKSVESNKEPDGTPQQAIEAFGEKDRVDSQKLFPTSLVELPVYISLPEKGVRRPEKRAGYVFWDPQTFTTTSAIVGHLLQEAPFTKEVVERLPEDIACQRTIFRPTAMNISRFLGTIPSLSNLPIASLVMRFLPSPWTTRGPRTLENLPPVEMRFAVDNKTKELKLKDIVSVVESTASNIMLPDRVLDLSFQQRTTRRLCALHYHQLPQISEFLAASQLNLLRGRLETPPMLTLPMATYLCGAGTLDSLHNPPNESIDAEYIFGGLEYRSTLALDFEGWKLLYTSVEGGPADGRRGELRLRPRRTGNDISDKEDSTPWIDEFIDAAYRLVDTLEDFDTPSVNYVKALSRSPSRQRLIERNRSFRYFNRLVNFMELKNENDMGDE